MTHLETTRDVVVLDVEVVAKTIAGIAQIGEAARALQRAGHTAVITFNRITVGDAVQAELHGVNGQGWWQVIAMDGSPPIWTVGTRQSHEVSSWMGCVE